MLGLKLKRVSKMSRVTRMAAIVLRMCFDQIISKGPIDTLPVLVHVMR